MEFRKNELKEISIRLDKNGNWFINDEPVTHKGISLFFSRSIIKENGGYWLKIGDVKIPVQVEDTPFIILSINRKKGKYFLLLNDGTTEALDPATLEVGEQNVLYCYVKNGAHRARFSRPAYYQIAEDIKQDENGYFINVQRKKYYIKT